MATGSERKSTTDHVVWLKTHFYSTFGAGFRPLGRSRWNVRGVRIILKVMDWRPEASEPDVREGDLVGVVRIREGFRFIISRLPETKSMFVVRKT